jgi:hypothetical protein
MKDLSVVAEDSAPCLPVIHLRHFSSLQQCKSFVYLYFLLFLFGELVAFRRSFELPGVQLEANASFGLVCTFLPGLLHILLENGSLDAFIFELTLIVLGNQLFLILSFRQSLLLLFGLFECLFFLESFKPIGFLFR